MAQGWNTDGACLDEAIGEKIMPVKAWRTEDRLTSVELLTLLVAYREGVSARALAKRYELGMTTVKRLLRKYEVRRGAAPDPGAAATPNGHHRSVEPN
jgi:hypothetical protein